jgi:BNR repeat-containing family member
MILMHFPRRRLQSLPFLFATLTTISLLAQGEPKVNLVPVGEGFAKDSVNAPIFRSSSVLTHGDMQYTAFYDGDGYMVLAKRQLNSNKWETRRSQYKGHVEDAHNAISIGIDGKGVLHVSWAYHNHPINYAQSTQPGGLELGQQGPMTGKDESSVTYPQFYNLPSGDLLFIYREGGSGNGNTMLNRYDMQSGKWQPVHHPLINGEGKRNAYTNHLAVDSKGGLHLSWVWRESPDVASNHDICYAYSPDGGKAWQTSAGKPYTIPITRGTAEIVCPVPPNSELINQTSMTTDQNDHPIIASYWRTADSNSPQYRVVCFDGKQWKTNKVTDRKQAFRLSGGGTKRIPISRPQVVAGAAGEIYVIFRDEERGNGVSVAISNNAARTNWRVLDILKTPVGAWEPSYDPIRWARDKQLDLFVQNVGQGDAEKLENLPPQTVSILEWKP